MSKEVQELILQEFGLKDGMRILAVVLPNILKDFENMLAKSLIGIEVSEEYKFDDREGSIIVYGIRKGQEQSEITRIKIHGKEARM